MELSELYGALVEKLMSWLETSVEMLPNLAVALVVLGIFWALSLVAQKLSGQALARVNTNKAARNLMSTLVRVCVLLAGVVVALGVLNLDKALASILAGAGVVGLALGFAFQDLAANLISGVGLAVNKEIPFQIGDLVETNDVFGIVKKIHLRTSLIQTLDGKTVVIPNKQVFQNKVVNYNATGGRRVDVECGVSYGDDLEKVKSVATDAIDNLTCRDKDKGVDFFFTGFGDSSINFVARFWVDFAKNHDFLVAKSDAVMALKQAFDNNDIMIPFPIRTLDFGIRGGEPLTQVLSSTPLRLHEGSNGKGSKPRPEANMSS